MRATYDSPEQGSGRWLVGVRHAVASIVFDVELECDVDGAWRPGPFPFELPATGPGSATATATDATARLSYFQPRTAVALYGTRDDERRWHRSCSGAIGECEIEAAELLMATLKSDRPRAFAIVHVSLPPADPVAALARLVRINDQSVRSALTDVIAPAAICKDARRAMSVAFARLDSDEGFAESTLPWSALNQWLWTLASATPILPGGSIEPIVPDSDDPRVLRGLVYLSATWRALVLRDGAAFVGIAESESRFLDSFASVYVRSIYLDALLLGLLQQRALNHVANRLAELDDRAERHALIPGLEDDLTTFRSVLWWQHVTTSGPGNDLLMAFQAQHRLPALLDQIVLEFADYARQVESASNLRASAALGLITLFGLPLTLAVAGDPVLSSEGAGRLLWVLLFGLVLGVVILLLPAARELVEPLRRRSRRSSRRRDPSKGGNR